jgi:glyceraldehyde-3-phosphate dehydrogenase type I
MSRSVRIGINGLGRIGRALIREIHRINHSSGSNLEVVALNNPGKREIYAHLLQYDSVHGTFSDTIELEDQVLRVGSNKINFYAESDPSKIPWGDSSVDIVIDASGVFKDQKSLEQHLRDSVKQVVLCAPGKNIDATLVFGVNHTSYNPEQHKVISNASCTTNCLAPIVKVLNSAFGIEKGLMTTIHAYTNDQNLLDSSHGDFRRARAAACSMIPTSTGATSALGKVIPEVEGKFDGYAVRVPTSDVSMVDLAVEFKQQTSIEKVHQVIREASEGELKNVIQFVDKPLVSCDFLGNPHSSIYDAQLTQQAGGLYKIVIWYDNEIGFTNRVIDLTSFIGAKLWG